MLVIGNIKMEIKHPNYYKNLRKLARLRNRDQAISGTSSTEQVERAPGTGLKQQASSAKQQASSESKPEPSSGSQASSDKR